MEFQRKKIVAVRIDIVRFVDDYQSGFVECKFKDAWGREHILIEKVPIVTANRLDAESEYPQAGEMDGEWVRKWIDPNGRTIITVHTLKPWGIETTEGIEEFDLLPEQLK